MHLFSKGTNLNHAIFRDPFNKGRLIIVFNVIFPEKLSPEVVKRLTVAFQPIPKSKTSADVEKVSMLDFDGQARI